MKKSCLPIIAAVSLAGFSSLGFSSPSLFSGPLNTLGNVSTRQTVLSATHNPAAGEYVVKNTYRWSYLNGAGVGFEVGEVDDLIDSVDMLIEELDRLEEQADVGVVPVTQADIEAVQAEYNGFLVELGQKGNLQLNAQTRVPGFPVAIRNDYIKGVVTLDARAGVDVGVKFIDSPLEIIAPVFPETSFRLRTSTFVDLTSLFMTSFSIGYSHDLANSYFKRSANDESEELGKSSLENWLKNRFSKGDDKLLVGLGLNLYKAEMSTQLVAIDQEDTNEELADIISDQYEDNQVSSTDFGLDLGVLWISDKFLVGATWKNINEPRFESSELGINCTSLQTVTAQNNCTIAAQLGASGRIDLKPEYVMENQLSVEGTVYTENRHWSFSGGLDLNEVAGPVGNDYQWMTLSASFFTDSFWIPSVRAGYRTNLSGSELSYVNTGLTLFGGSHIDLSYALDSVSIDEDDFPRSLAINFGFERRF